MNTNEILDKKYGHSFMFLEELFWIDILTISLEKYQGSVLIASESLGISTQTFRNRCRQHGVIIDCYRDKRYGIRLDRLNKWNKWKSEIDDALKSTSNRKEIAKMLGLKYKTLCQRMRTLETINCNTVENK
jgi:DNA-binding NtrC family response regulator